ncbi:MAG: AAA family ATPase, partial [Planctomycetia bacterium]|nr:AAA family ATPase [Planctomycetia bacterium]
TTVARLYGRILNQIGVLPGSAFVEVGRSDLVSEFKGATAVKTRDVIRRAEGGVLFIDEAYSLVPLGVGNASDYGYEAIAELVLAAENMRDRLVIVVAGYPMEMGRFMESNPGLQSRFRPAVVFPDMSGPALLEALERLAKRAGYRFTESARKGLSAYISEIPRGANFGRCVRKPIGSCMWYRTPLANTMSQPPRSCSMNAMQSPSTNRTARRPNTSLTHRHFR